MPLADYSYLGAGKIYLREIGASLGFLEVGNCSALSFSVSEEEKKLKDFTTGGGGTKNSVKRIDAVTAAFTMHDINSNNLARAIYGSTGSVASASVSGESVTVYPEAMAPFAFMPAASPAPTVVPAQASAAARANATPYALGAYVTPATANGYYYKATTAGTSGGSIPTYPTTIGGTVTDGTVVWTCAGKTTLVAGTDYEVRGGGVYVLGSPTIAGEVWTVGYTKAATDVVQAITGSGKEYEMLFDGLNEARSGKRTRITAYRVKPGALQNFGLIGEDYAALEVSGEILQDSSKTGAGISKYFKVEFEA